MMTWNLNSYDRLGQPNLYIQKLCLADKRNLSKVLFEIYYGMWSYLIGNILFHYLLFIVFWSLNNEYDGRIYRKEILLIADVDFIYCIR